MGHADVNFYLADVKIDPVGVLPRRVRNLLGLLISAAYTSAPGGASLFRMWFLIRSWFLVAFLITIAFLIYNPDFEL